MSSAILSIKERHQLLKRHKRERDRRVADRIKDVLWRDDGWSYRQIAEALFLTEEGVRKQLKDYEERGKLSTDNGGSTSQLNEHQTLELVAHLQGQLYMKAGDICESVANTLRVRYSVSGMTDWLKRHGFTFHQPAPVPAKANAEEQQAFVAHYETLKRTMDEDDHIVFIDGVHPTHQVRFTKGWIKKGVRKLLPTNGSQKRMNIMGALNLAEMKVHHQEFLTINAETIINFLTYLTEVMPHGMINVILDRARYHTCPEVMEWIATQPRLRLHFLPRYSPNLNAIERLWKIMHEHTTNNQYHAHFKQFTEKITEFFEVTFPNNALQWTDRLTDNFQIIGTPTHA